jgi:PelA/Pel-15E family pectate lyase
LTLEAAPARKFEVASLSGWESANVVRFLMSIEPATPEIKTSIESAMAWFEASKITGFDIVSGLNAAGGRTFALQPNPNAKPLWARFYELGTNRPIFVTREAKVYYNLSDLDQSDPDRGYNWYVNFPQKLVEQDYPKWHAKGY